MLQKTRPERYIYVQKEHAKISVLTPSLGGTTILSFFFFFFFFSLFRLLLFLSSKAKAEAKVARTLGNNGWRRRLSSSSLHGLPLVKVRTVKNG